MSVLLLAQRSKKLLAEIRKSYEGRQARSTDAINREIDNLPISSNAKLILKSVASPELIEMGLMLGMAGSPAMASTKGAQKAYLTLENEGIFTGAEGSRFGSALLKNVKKIATSKNAKSGLKVKMTTLSKNIARAKTGEEVAGAWTQSLKDSAVKIRNALKPWGPGLLLWFLVDNVPMAFRTVGELTGTWPKDISWRIKDRMDLVKSDHFNIKDAMANSDYAMARTSLASMRGNLDSLTADVEHNRGTLDDMKMYDVAAAGITVFEATYTNDKEMIDKKAPDVGPLLVEKMAAKVSDVLDGDTIKVYAGSPVNKSFTLRMVGIDAPEKATTRGKAAKKWLEGKIEKKNISIFVDLNNAMDTYSRVLGVVELGGKDINLEELRLGHAVTLFIGRNTQIDEARYLDAEAEAKEKKLGIWKEI